MSERLFETERVTRQRTSRDLVVIEPGNCPACGDIAVTECVTEVPLLRHGGYGAARASSRRHCPRCGWTMLAEVSEVRP